MHIYDPKKEAPCQIVEYLVKSGNACVPMQAYVMAMYDEKRGARYIKDRWDFEGKRVRYIIRKK